MQVDPRPKVRNRITPLDLGIGLIALLIAVAIFTFTAFFAGVFS